MQSLSFRYTKEIFKANGKNYCSTDNQSTFYTDAKPLEAAGVGLQKYNKKMVSCYDKLTYNRARAPPDLPLKLIMIEYSPQYF